MTGEAYLTWSPQFVVSYGNLSAFDCEEPPGIALLVHISQDGFADISVYRKPAFFLGVAA